MLLSNRPFSCFISVLHDPWLNLAIEDWIFRKNSGWNLLLYRNNPCVVIGRNQNPWKECRVASLESAQIPLIRRQSGGGTVYHDLGNTNYSIMMPRAQFNMKTQAELVARSLLNLDVPAYVTDRSAYRVIQNRAFHHGTMLIDADLKRLENFLDVDSKFSENMQSKSIGSVKSQVANLSDFSFTISSRLFSQSVVLEFLKATQSGGTVDDVEDIQEGVHYGLITQEDITDDVWKYADSLKTWDWLYGNSPDFSVGFKLDRHDCVFHCHRGIISGVEVPAELKEFNGRLQGVRFNAADIRKVFESSNKLQTRGLSERLIKTLF